MLHIFVKKQRQKIKIKNKSKINSHQLPGRIADCSQSRRWCEFTIDGLMNKRGFASNVGQQRPSPDPLSTTSGEAESYMGMMMAMTRGGGSGGSLRGEQGSFSPLLMNGGADDIVDVLGGPPLLDGDGEQGLSILRNLGDDEGDDDMRRYNKRGRMMDVESNSGLSAEMEQVSLTPRTGGYAEMTPIQPPLMHPPLLSAAHSSLPHFHSATSGSARHLYGGSTFPSHFREGKLCTGDAM
jgi:hypothetical protein